MNSSRKKADILVVVAKMNKGMAIITSFSTATSPGQSCGNFGPSGN